ncbi:hypothetical protein RN001_011423 [Aquatica leii]|uniref:Uncharacterized protein n=1 Tax=Aquatica leii TaxID=1421715 RepID=A0AAN7P5Q0_9COLE|nr:hypothetical protein RN001_011423 [Aquatica leii]
MDDVIQIDFFENIEQTLNAKFPKYVKNIFKFNALDNNISMSSLSEDDLRQIEEFVKEDLINIIGEAEREHYLGPFKNHPEKFQFLIGIKKLIFAAKDLLSAQVQLRKQSSTSKSTRPVGGADSNLSVDIDLNAEQKKLKKLMDWMNNFFRRKEISDQNYITSILQKLRDFDYTCSQCTPGGLKCTISCPRLRNSNRFDIDLKRFCLYLLITAGRFLYETLYANLPKTIPSITTLHRMLNDNTQFIEEGTVRLEELKKFLESRYLPNVVWISKDATKITGRIEYNSKNNKIVGFCLPQVNGLPDRKGFLALSARHTSEYFENEKRSDYAYVVMAQCPNNNSPAFCLAVYGTDNCFTHQSVLDRWSYINKEAARVGIQILGYSSDSDTICMKAMRICSKLHNVGDDVEGVQWKWFRMNLIKGFICVQDTVHIGFKLRIRLLKKNIVLPMGQYSATADHLHLLISDISKDHHLLTASDLHCEDKMNFRPAEKISSEMVTDLLKKHVPKSKATVIYLNLMRLVLTAFLSKELSVTERLRRMWHYVFS